MVDKNCETFVLNYGDIEVLNPPSRVNSDLFLSDFSYPIDLVRLLHVKKDEEGEVPETNPE